MINKTKSMKKMFFMAAAVFFISLQFTMPSAYGQQKPRLTQFTRDGYVQEMHEYLDQGTSDKNRKADNVALIERFSPVFGQQTDAIQDRIVAISNVLLKQKIRQFPDVVNFLETFMAMDRDGGDNFEQWVSSLELIQRRSKRLKDFTDFNEFVTAFLKDRSLYFSRTCTWQTQAGVSFRIVPEGNDVLFRFDKPMELYYGSDQDNGTIYGTKGTFYYFENKWKGEGGRLNWDRTGIPTSQCWAILGKYEASVKHPKFSADSVQFTNTAYFGQPIFGSVEESLNAKKSPDKYTYPKFCSYQKDFVLNDLLPGVDYRGSFMMNGAKFVTSDDKNPATLIFHRDGKPFITVRSTKFTITASRMESEKADVVILLDGDSISNTGVTVRYLLHDKQVTIVNDARRNFYSPFSNSYHDLDIYCESIVWKMSEDKIEFAMMGQNSDQTFTTFESANYYSERKFRDIQGIDQVNPVIRVYRYVQHRGMTYDFFMDEFAKAIKMDVMQAKLMIHTLAKSGLVSYNESLGIIHVNDKLIDYARASARNTEIDYDAIVMESSAKGNNAELDLATNNLYIRGIDKFVLSDSQQVVIYPKGGELVVQRNLDIEFSGRINVGRFMLFAKDVTFRYEEFKLDLPQIDSMIFYVTMFNNPQEEHIVYTPLTHLKGHLQIDQSDNHHGLKRVKEQYPIFTSLEDCYVYYDDPKIHRGAYIRDRFYYTVKPFVIKNLVHFVTDSLSFNGVLTSAGIFPDIVEPLKVQPDYSLGFVRKTPSGGFEAYGGKGRYTNVLDLSYRGFRARGTVEYLTSIIESNTIYFMPDSMVAVSDTFYVKEADGFPDIRNGRTMPRWYPYADSMRVSQLLKGPQFRMYHGQALLDGHLVLKPGECYASGIATISDGVLESQRFALQTMDMYSNVTAFTLTSEIYKNTAFFATNMKSHVDYKTRTAEFLSNADIERTLLPIMQYAAYVDKFVWAIDKKELAFVNSKSENSLGLEGLTLRERFDRKDQPGALLVSTDPACDSLSFHALQSLYRYNDAQLSCHGVFTIESADAVLAPGGDTLHIGKGGTIDMMRRSQILASSDSLFHLIYEAEVFLSGAKKYTGKGLIDYVDENEKVQRIYLYDVSLDNRGVTVGKGFIADSVGFTLNNAFGFAGDVRVEGDKKHYFFDGGIRMLYKCGSKAQPGLLAYADYTDPHQILVPVPEIPTDWKGNRITASMLFDKNDMSPYPAFLTQERAADNELMGAWGFVTYNKNTEEYMISSAEKIEDPQEVVDRYLTLNRRTCEMTGEGPINFNVKQNHIKLFNYGTATLAANGNLQMNTILGFTFPIDEKVLGAMAQFLSDDLRLSQASPSGESTRHAMIYYMGEEEGAEAYSDYVSSGFFDKIPAEFASTILVEGVNWIYTPELGYHYDGVATLSMVGKKQLHLATRIKAQLFKKGTGVNLVLYIQAASDHWYYFNYEFNSQSMTIQSSVGEWVDMIKALPAAKRRITGHGDEGDFHYRISPSRNEVPNFLLRMGGNAEAEDDPGDWDVDDDDVIPGDE